MTTEAMRSLARQMIDLYDRKSYAEAYELVTSQADRFPEWARRIYFWRACLATRMEDRELALELLEEALDRGHWFWRTGLTDDSDLEPLRGLPRFDQVVAESVRRQEMARENAPPPERIVLEPDITPAQVQLLVALHGNYTTAHDSLEYWEPATASGWIVALPQSSQRDGPEGRVWMDRDWTLSEVKEHHASLASKYGPDPGRTVIGGFSMGGWWAIWMALGRSLPARGFVAVAPYIPDADQLIPLLRADRDEPIRGYLILGEQDTGSLQGSQDVAALMNEHELACELEIRPELGHAYPDDFPGALNRALGYLTASRG